MPSVAIGTMNGTAALFSGAGRVVSPLRCPVAGIASPLMRRPLVMLSNAVASAAAFPSTLKENHAMKRKTTPQTRTATRDQRLDAVLGALEKKAPTGQAPAGSCRRLIYCF